MADSITESYFSMSNMADNSSEFYTEGYRYINYSGCQKEFINSPASTVGLPVLLGLVFVVGVFADTLVLYIVYTNKQINALFFNIAVAHLILLLLCIPVFCLRYITSYKIRLTDPVCKMVYFFTYVTVGVSVNCLVGICLLKYIAISRPVGCKVTRRHAVLVAVLIWIIIGSANAPLLWYYQERDGTVCMLQMRTDVQYIVFIALTFGLDFALPVITVCCITLGIVIQFRRQELHESSRALRRTNRRFVRLVLIILLVFVLTWGPFHLAYFLAMFGVYDSRCPKQAAILNFAIVLALSNTCLNPVVYHMASLEFRKAFWSTLRRAGTGSSRLDSGNASAELNPLSAGCRTDDLQMTSVSYTCSTPVSTTAPA